MTILSYEMGRLQYLRKHLGAYCTLRQMPLEGEEIPLTERLVLSQKEEGTADNSSRIWLKSEGLLEVAASCWTFSTGRSGCSEDFSSKIYNNSASCSDMQKPFCFKKASCWWRQHWQAIAAWKACCFSNTCWWSWARQSWRELSSGSRRSNSFSFFSISEETFSSTCFNNDHSFLVWNS